MEFFAENYANTQTEMYVFFYFAAHLNIWSCHSKEAPGQIKGDRYNKMGNFVNLNKND